jgi:addiction module HigA family antidote
MRLSQSEVARRLGISRRRVNELVMGHRAMSPDTAIRCALAFGLPASTWLAMQSDWDCWHTWQSLRQALQTPEGRAEVALPESLVEPVRAAGQAAAEPRRAPSPAAPTSPAAAPATGANGHTEGEASGADDRLDAAHPAAQRSTTRTGAPLTPAHALGAVRPVQRDPA